MAPIRQDFDPLIGGVGDRRVVIEDTSILDRPVDARDDSYVDPDAPWAGTL